MTASTCRGCGAPLVYGGRGRPSVWCADCRDDGRREQKYTCAHAHRNQCKCGNTCWSGELCRECFDKARRDAHDVRYGEIERRWKAGEPIREIAAALGTSANSIGVELYRMRREGWDVPHRYRLKERSA